MGNLDSGKIKVGNIVLVIVGGYFYLFFEFFIDSYNGFVVFKISMGF